MISPEIVCILKFFYQLKYDSQNSQKSVLHVFCTYIFACINTLKKEVKYEQAVLSFFFSCFHHFKCCFCLQQIKTKPYSANKAKLLFTNIFFSYDSYIYSKKASCPACGDLGTSLLLCLSRLFASLVLLHKLALILTGRHSSSHKKKKLTKFVYFLETTMYESSIF